MGKFLRLSGGVARQFDEAGSSPIYDEVYDILSPVTTGTPLTLPSSQTYDSDELEVYLGVTRLIPLADYNYVSTPPRTQISFTFNLEIGDKIRFRIDRSA